MVLARLVAPALAVALFTFASTDAPLGAPVSAGPAPLPTAAWNENTTSAGRLANGTLTLSLEIAKGAWHPLGPDKPAGEVLLFSETGKAPLNPGPMIRVPEGTMLRVTVTNRHDSTLVVRGLSGRRAATMDSLLLAPGETKEARFSADVPGTYYYWAGSPGVPMLERFYDDAQLNGAFIVDPAGVAPKAGERVMLISGWVQAKTKDGFPDFNSAFLVINGRPWPLTERLTYDVGDSVHWRWINASEAPHPLHLHGFYFQVEARGDAQRDTTYWTGQRRMVVTELLQAGQTMAMNFVPDRPGGWIFHCHLSFHTLMNNGVGPDTIPSAEFFKALMGEHGDHDPDNHVEKSMGGLIMAFYVRPNGKALSAGDRRAVRLFVTSDSSASRPERRFSYVVQDGPREPASDSVRSPGSTLILHRGEPTSVWVINRSPQPTQVHWHGLEIDSPFDGVVGVGGFKGMPTPAIMPGDSFQMRVTPPRSGSFMYHTHINDLMQQSRGLWGAILVLEPGQTWDREHDFVFQAGPSPEDPGDVVMNGRGGGATFEPITIKARQTYRLRLMNVSIDGPNLRYWLTRNGTPTFWTPVAVDGQDLPAHQRLEVRAEQGVSIGKTADFELKDVRAGKMQLELRGGGGGLIAIQPFTVLDWQTADEQIASAVLPMPEPLRAGATVLGYREVGKLEELRKGTNGMICLADDPLAAAFHVACYHEGMEPFMARGRALRAEGVTGEAVDSARYREAKEGKLLMPTKPAALWQMSGAPGSYDPVKNEVKDGRSLYVVYMPYATEASTGLPTRPAPGIPWLMNPGTPKAHIMFVPGM